MIESGSRVERFGLPDHTAARFEMPAPALRGLVGSYHVFDSKKEWRDGVKPWLLPSWPAIRFILAPDAIALTIGSRRYDPMPVAALYGNASRAMQMTTHGGVTIGVDLPGATLEDGWPTQVAIDAEVAFMRRTLATALGRKLAGGRARFEWGEAWARFDPKGFMANSGIRYTPRS